MELGHWLVTATVAAVMLACFAVGYILGWSLAWKCAENPDCRKVKRRMDEIDAEGRLPKTGVKGSRMVHSDPRKNGVND